MDDANGIKQGLEQDLRTKTELQERTAQDLTNSESNLADLQQRIDQTGLDVARLNESLKEKSKELTKSEELVKSRGTTLGNTKNELMILTASHKLVSEEVQRLKIFENAMVWARGQAVAVEQKHWRAIDELLYVIQLRDPIEASKFGLGQTAENHGVFHHFMRLFAGDVALLDINALLEALNTDEATLAAAGLVVSLKNLTPTSILATLAMLKSIRELCCRIDNVGLLRDIVPSNSASSILIDALVADIRSLLEQRQSSDMAQYIRDHTAPGSTRAVCGNVDFLRHDQDLVMLQDRTVVFVPASSWKVEQEFDEETCGFALRIVISDAPILGSWTSPWWEENWYYVNVLNITNIGVT